MSTQKNLDQSTEQSTPSHEEISNFRLTRRQFLSRGVATIVLAIPALTACEFPSSPSPTETVAAPTVAAPPPTGTPGNPAPISDPIAKTVWLKDIPTISLEDFQDKSLEVVCQMMQYEEKHYRLFDFINAPGMADREHNYPGPTLRINISNGNSKRIKINLTNNLPNSTNAMSDNCNESRSVIPKDNNKQAFDYDSHPNCFHGDNTINLHYHGSHVQPEYGTAPFNGPPYGDNVLIKIKPGEQASYDFEIGPDQAPGTHWYHPHKHGATALHVLNGMVGALIVEGDFDTELNNLFNHPPEEKILVLHQHDDSLYNGGGKEILINGDAQPVIKMRTGEIQRWRIVNATMQQSAHMQLTFEKTEGNHDIKAYQIAMDGVQFSQDLYSNELTQNQGPILISPANRADYLVQAPPEIGEYHLKGKQILSHGEKGAIIDEKAVLIKEKDAILKVRVIPGDPTNYASNLPDAGSWPNVPRFLSPIEPSEIQSNKKVCLVYNMDKKNGGPMAPNFYIDGKKFNENIIDHTMVLGEPEEWTIYNTSPVAHPFHIHINPFFVVEIYDPTRKAYGEDVPLVVTPTPTATAGAQVEAAADAAEDTVPLTLTPMRWQDTILLPPAKIIINTETGETISIDPGYVIIRQRFLQFAGKFVNHCHMLGHEDRGMMQLLQTVHSGNFIPYGTEARDKPGYKVIEYNDITLPDNPDRKNRQAVIPIDHEIAIASSEYKEIQIDRTNNANQLKPR